MSVAAVYELLGQNLYFNVIVLFSADVGTEKNERMKSKGRCIYFSKIRDFPFFHLCKNNKKAASLLGTGSAAY
ncbi:hypothetical protein [uncultured Desulfuromonas sp.]|uniref:hypothetical protein n=1 Tax=uncultured Desulfuromonas sp. TaxID=181013 RepID=UPI002AAB5D5F|nr:hypothetical protein [uncultured Desulfuromonas sp.]